MDLVGVHVFVRRSQAQTHTYPIIVRAVSSMHELYGTRLLSLLHTLPSSPTNTITSIARIHRHTIGGGAAATGTAYKQTISILRCVSIYKYVC